MIVGSCVRRIAGGWDAEHARWQVFLKVWPRDLGSALERYCGRQQERGRSLLFFQKGPQSQADGGVAPPAALVLLAPVIAIPFVTGAPRLAATSAAELMVLAKKSTAPEKGPNARKSLERATKRLTA